LVRMFCSVILVLSILVVVRCRAMWCAVSCGAVVPAQPAAAGAEAQAGHRPQKTTSASSTTKP
jgi:hypothetical protein